MRWEPGEGFEHPCGRNHLGVNRFPLAALEEQIEAGKVGAETRDAPVPAGSDGA